MNQQMWNLYKESARGKNIIKMFDPETEDVGLGMQGIFEFSSKLEGNMMPNMDDLMDYVFQYDANIMNRLEVSQEDFTRESFAHFINELDIIPADVLEDGTLQFDEAARPFLKKNDYRRKAADIYILSVVLYFEFNFFKPMLLSSHFNVMQSNCNVLGIELPPIPKTKDYREYLTYYYDICTAWKEFQEENSLTDAECCACIYDYATLMQEPHENQNLPKPINVWLTGASGKFDFDVLEDMLKGDSTDSQQIWACNERTRRGDLIVIYCLSPKSCIHSIWRANSGGMFNPFDYYHCRTTVCDGVATPIITFNDLKTDAYFSQIPIVRKNLQGINGVQLTAKDYSELLRLIADKGGNIEEYPRLFENKSIDFGEIKLEKDVEEKILIPMLQRLGYTEQDWTRQLSQKAGRGLKAIPDFVF